MSISHENETTGFPETLPVYTFLHGGNALERFDATFDPETLSYRIPVDIGVDSGFVFSLPSCSMIDRYHFLFFQGMTIEAGMSNRVKHIDILWASKQESDSENPFVIRANKNRVARWVRGDYSLQIDSLPYRYRDGSIVEQRLLSHLVAVPKGDARFLFITFEKDSLRPLFKSVRSLSGGLSIETVNGY